MKNEGISAVCILKASNKVQPLRTGRPGTGEVETVTVLDRECRK